MLFDGDTMYPGEMINAAEPYIVAIMGIGFPWIAQAND